ncbi:hypothetical protein M758_8G128800 [Ceratodon purpureus]|nr:hypothetical protein M758_8G128800 [Ceratodon purpureus]
MASEGEDQKKVYTLEEVGQHVAQDDCWMVINGKVYNLTSFMDDHPGGDDVLLQVAGRDATNEFEDVGHSKAAIEQMQDFFVGKCPQVFEKAELLSVTEGDLAIGGSASPPAPTNSVGIWSKILQFLVPLVFLGIAVAIRNVGKKDPEV